MPDGSEDRLARSRGYRVEPGLDARDVNSYESRLQFGRLMEACREEIFVFRADTFRFLLVNRGARENLGFTMDDLSVMTPLDIKPDMDGVVFGSYLLKLTSGEAEVVQFQTRHLRKDGSSYPVEVRLQFFPDERPAVFLATISDITERVAAEAELLQIKREAEESSRVKSEFLASISHELRTPLNAVIGFSELLLSDPGRSFGPDRTFSYLEDIRDAGRHQLALIGDVLDFAKIDAGRLTLHREKVAVVNLFRTVERFEQSNARTRRVSLEFVDLGPDLWVLGDEIRLRQILINLIDNAIKFTPEGGHVSVSAISVARGGATFEIRDDGPGIAKEDLDSVFEPFVQLKHARESAAGGTGLGLALVKKLVELQGGWLRLASTLGEGTTVRFWLPGSENNYFDI